MGRAKDALKDRPVAKTASAMPLMAPSFQKVGHCGICNSAAFTDLKVFADVIFASEIEKVTSKVRHQNIFPMIAVNS